MGHKQDENLVATLNTFSMVVRCAFQVYHHTTAALSSQSHIIVNINFLKLSIQIISSHCHINEQEVYLLFVRHRYGFLVLKDPRSIIKPNYFLLFIHFSHIFFPGTSIPFLRENIFATEFSL